MHVNAQVGVDFTSLPSAEFFSDLLSLREDLEIFLGITTGSIPRSNEPAS